MSETAPPPPPTAAKKKPKRPWRDNLEALGAAILMAVLLKPTVIEAYAIPTSSMQPTLMGSAEAGVFDRILVDKLIYTIFEPERWDIVVFRYPIRRNQNYVKRLVGMPGDRLRIMGGNVYDMREDGTVATVLRKPDRVQAGLWKEIYPARRRLHGSGDVLGEYWYGSGGRWREDGDDLVATASRGRELRLGFTNHGDGGLVNRIYDGYPVDVARAIKDADARPYEGVQDVRARFVVTPGGSLDVLRVELRTRQAGKKDRLLALVAEGGRARLVAERGPESLASEPFDFALPAGEATEVAFAHLDERLIAWRGGEQVAELEVGAFRVWTEIEPGKSTLDLRMRGVERAVLAELTVERDLHYTPDGVEDEMPLAVPDGHYFMMGDNTLASADSRQWREITVGAMPDGRMVDPERHEEARELAGNSRAFDLDQPPDPDENPVVIRTRDKVVFTDEYGEVYVLDSEISNAYGSSPGGGPVNMVFREIPGQSESPHEWRPEEVPVYFVPREHVLGRPVLTFWPIWPLGPMRLGFIR